MGRYGRLGKNTILVFIGNAGSKLIGLIMLPFYTRWLSVEDYGITDIIGVYVSLLSGICTCCISESIFIFPKNVPYSKKRAYFSSGLLFLFLSFIATAVIFYVVNRILTYKGVNNSFTNYTWLIYGLMISMTFQQFTQQFSRSIDKMSIYSITGVVLTVLLTILSFILIPFYGIYGYVISMILSYFMSALFSLFCSKGYFFISYKSSSWSVCSDMLKYSMPLIPNAIMWWLVGALNRPIMESYLGLHDIGIFALSNKFPGILSMVFAIFVSSWQISVLEEYGKKGYEEFYNKILRIIFIFLFCIFVGLTLSSKLLVNIFASEEYHVAWKYIPILTFGVLFSCLSGFTGSTFTATHESKYFFYSSIWGAMVSVILNILLIPTIGLLGAAISVVLSFVVIAISRVIYSWRYVHITAIGKYMVTLCLGIILIISMYLISNFILNFGIGIVVVLMVLYINKDILHKLRIKLNKIQK